MFTSGTGPASPLLPSCVEYTHNTNYSLCITENSTTTSSAVNITGVNIVHSETGKVPGHLKRKYQDQVSSTQTTLYWYLML